MDLTYSLTNSTYPTQSNSRPTFADDPSTAYGRVLVSVRDTMLNSLTLCIRGEAGWQGNWVTLWLKNASPEALSVEGKE